MRKYIISLCMGVLFVACASEKKAQERRQKKELELIQQLQGKYAGNPDPWFLQVPGGNPQLYFTTPCPDFDSGKVKSKGGKLTVTIPCPPVTINGDSLIKNSTLFKMTILEAGKNAILHSQEQAKNADLQSRLDKTEKQMKALIKAVIWLSAGCFILLAWTFRKPILKLILKAFA